MKTSRLFRVVVIAAAIFFAVRLMADVPSALLQPKYFAIGGTGFAGKMSEGERALRAVLAQSDAVTLLESSLSRASPAGQLYILLGLHVRDRAAYRRAFTNCEKRDGHVDTMRGCSYGHELFQDVVRQIDHGDFDSFTKRPAW